MKPWILLPLLIAGCIPDSAAFSIEQGRWANYHDFTAGVWKYALADQSAPQSVKDAFAECVADRTVKNMTPEEAAQLDQYARGNQGLSVGDSRRINAAINARSGLGPAGRWTNDNIGLLSDTCPADVPSFHQYLKL